MELFKEFEEDRNKDKEKSALDEVYVCGECGMFGYDRSRMLAHIEKTHCETQLEELKIENKRAYKELSEMKSTLYEVQLQLQESEQTLAETMREVICLEEDNRDKAKIVDRLLSERSTVDEYEEDGEETGFWNATNDEINSSNDEPDVVEKESLDKSQLKCPKCDFVPSNPIYMKSHMLIKHKEDQTECLKCNKKLPSRQDLNEHIKKFHSKNLHPCTYCEAKFVAAHALKQHVNSVHKEAQILPVGHPDRAAQQNTDAQISHKRFRCRICDKGHMTAKMLDEHLRQCAQDKSKQMCTFFVEGRCTRGNWCKFSHHMGEQHVRAQGPQAQQSKSYGNQECRRGPHCRFLAQNRCIFFHQVQYNKPRQQLNLSNQPKQQRKQKNMMSPRYNQQQESDEYAQPC